jgi:SAM-dependent methyltransferase
MHDTARQTGQAFFKIYGRETGTVLDIGSMDINGTLKDFVPSGMNYCGADLFDGKNVNIVLSNPYNFPFAEGDCDLIVSTSCFEHDQFFWLTFIEMSRVVRRGGFIYISAPVGGPVHRHPIDAWRFYPDAGRALESWARFNGHEIDLIESFLRPPGPEGWQDFVAVFGKQPFSERTAFVADCFPDTMHRLP